MPPASLISNLSGALDRSLPVPLSVQLKGLIEYGIACGELPPGTRLPSVRELAEAGGIAPMTAAAVYRELREARLIVTRPGSGTYVAKGAGSGAALVTRIQAHLDAALAEAVAAGLPAADVASLLAARISRDRARERRPLRLVMVGVFPEATAAYAEDIAGQLKPGDTIHPATLEELKGVVAAGGVEALGADLFVTLANRKAEVEALVGAALPVTSVSLMPAEATRARLAALDPMTRLAVVSVFPEFLALMKPGVRSFAPHVRSVAATVLDDPQLADILAAADVVVYATGAEAALRSAPAGVTAIEYRHTPDPHAVQDELLPFVETLRGAPPMRRPAFEPQAPDGAVATARREVP
jgi:DNA-binding transcriptional regulator YhcF (GntR family)